MPDLARIERCGSVGSRVVSRLSAAGAVTCARYPEGDLLGAVLPADSGLSCEEVGTLSSPADRCVQRDNVVFVGGALAAGRLERNLARRLAHAGPHVPPEGARFHAFAVLDEKLRSTPAYIEATVLGDDPQRLLVSLTFGDPGQAEDFVTIAQDRAAYTAVPWSGEADGDPLPHVVALLYSSLDQLSQAGQSEETVSARKTLAEAKALLEQSSWLQGTSTTWRQDESSSTAPPLLSHCKSPLCAWAALAPHVPAPTLVEAKERSVRITFDFGQAHFSFERALSVLSSTSR